MKSEWLFLHFILLMRAYFGLLTELTVIKLQLLRVEELKGCGW